MIKNFFLLFFLALSICVKAQDSTKVTLSGSIKDAETGEALIGATVLAKVGVGAVADLDGNFILKLPKGDYNIEISMLGYGKYTQKIKLYSNKKIEVKLENTVLDEVEVVADVAQIRETPVAFSTISSTKIQEEAGGRDISMMVNSTPGAYATSSGGGLGDSRVTIRGFDQRNIGVLVDGIPVNDMENGQVYWSNWDGLKDITKSMQIQRGLGASKLAISSIGGTMNFITNGIDSKRQLTIKKEFGNNRYNLMAMSYNSGIINNKWGFTLAGTYKTGDGWAQQTWFNAYSYFVKVQYMPNQRHIISIGANAAPQSHGQRTTQMPISVYDKAYAAKLGVNQGGSYMDNLESSGYISADQSNRDLKWNPNVGVLDKTTIFNEKVNVFNKPLFNLNHFWKISEKTTLSTVAYASFGKGGGTSASSSFSTRDPETGYYIKTSPPVTPPTASLLPGERKSSSFIELKTNDHNWFGILSTATTKLNKLFTVTYGLDLRYYQGFHTWKVYDLLGGDYYIETAKNPNLDNTNPMNFVKRKNDVFAVNYNSFVKWGGLFGQVEFKKDKWTAFFTATGSKSGYNRIDYYQKKDLVINGHVYSQQVRFGETFYTNGTDEVLAVRGATVTSNGDTTYIHNPSSAVVPIYNATGYDINSKEARPSTTGWTWQWGYTIKSGANYNINDHHNVFANFGVMQIPQRYDNTYNFSNKINSGFKAQKINSFELGYGMKYNRFYVNVNGYYTDWKNQPQASYNDADGNTYVLNGINALYKGIEFEGNYKPLKQLEFDAAVSFGDWRYNSGGIVYSYAPDNSLHDSIKYDATGVHLGNAAQQQISLGVRYMPFKGAYIKLKGVRFDKNYSNFRPTDLNYDIDIKGNVTDNRSRESWRMPAYYLCDLSAGYELPFKEFKVNIYGNVNNLFNFRYISDAQNNGYINNNSQGFDATSATVFFGVGRTFIIGTKLTF